MLADQRQKKQVRFTNGLEQSLSNIVTGDPETMSLEYQVTLPLPSVNIRNSGLGGLRDPGAHSIL